MKPANADAKAKLERASQAVGTALAVIRSELPTINAFLKEARDMETFGHIVNPSLYKDPEPRAVSALLEPVFEAAVSFVETYDAHAAKAKDALAKVNAA